MENVSLEKALAICLLNKNIASLLISGPTGSGKSFTLRQLCKQWKAKVVELPLHVSEEMLTEQLDLEKTLKTGRKIYAQSILDRASQSVLYVDDINLLRPNLLRRIQSEQTVLDTDKQFTLIGTMNPMEGTLDRTMLESFSLFVAVESPTLVERMTLLRGLRDTQTKVSEIQTGREEGVDTNLTLHHTIDDWQIESGRRVVAQIEPSEAMITLAATYALQAGVEGNAVEIILLEVAKSIAALDGKSYILPKHLEEATLYVLPHRMRKSPDSEPPVDEPNEQDQQNQGDEQNQQDEQNQPDEQNQESPEDEQQEDNQDEPSENNSSEDESDGSAEDNEEEHPLPPSGGLLPEDLAAIQQQLYQLSLAVNKQVDRFARQGSGKRMLTRTDTQQGRYVRAEVARGDVVDLALDATIRAAAPYQKYRDKKDLAIAIKPDDWRTKVREKRIGREIFFIVDASGSMGAKKRMGAVKGAIYSLLQDAYEKRDRVALIAFRREEAEVLLPLTRSIELAQKSLDVLPTGGKTPLANGLALGRAQMEQLFYKDRHAKPICILVTDGRATFALDGNPVQSAMAEAEKMKELGIECIVLDTEREFITLGIAKKIANLLGARYYAMKDINKNTIMQALSH